MSCSSLDSVIVKVHAINASGAGYRYLDLCCYDQISETRLVTLEESTHIDLPELSNGGDVSQATPCIPLVISQDRQGIASTLQDFGYSSQDKYNSLTLLRAAEAYGCYHEGPMPNESRSLVERDTRHKYISLVRRLPQQASLDTLIQTYFTSVNWQYGLLDENMFHEKLESWRQITYSDLRDESRVIAPGTLIFPALLLQVLAQALLFHDPLDQSISGLLTFPDMTFHDLAKEFNSTGNDVLSLLGKEALATTTVEAALLSASFLKSSGKVVEAWHALGASIRDAQELGLHIGQGLDEQRFNTTEESNRERAAGHKLWIVLHLWDAHMAVVLGRPMATSFRLHDCTHFITDEKERGELLLHWQTEEETPRPFDVIMAGYTVAYRYLQDIHELEHRNIVPKYDSTIDSTHAAIIGNMTLLPSWCCYDDPDTKFDVACPWLPAARESLCSLVNFVILALHRPYIFSQTESRTRALKAGVAILHAQERLFQQSEPHHLHLFTPVYASFDAMVLVTAIGIIFPEEARKDHADFVHVVERGVQRLKIVGQYNRVAQSAHYIVSRLHRRLRQRCVIPQLADSTSHLSSSAEGTTGGYTEASVWAIADLDRAAIAPPYPTHDFFSGDVPEADASSSLFQTGSSTNTSLGEMPEDWNFDKAFGDHSFWSVRNDFDSVT